jgi:hypothetical protein
MTFPSGVEHLLAVWTARRLKLLCRAASKEKSKALAELMIENRERWEAVLDWQETLDFGDAGLIFSLDKPHPKGESGLGDENWTLIIEIEVKQEKLDEMSTWIFGEDLLLGTSIRIITVAKLPLDYSR